MTLFHQLEPLTYGRVISTGEITTPETPEIDRISSSGEIKPRYENYLCFTVSVRTNGLGFYQEKYTTEQLQTHKLIKSLHDDGMGYRKIAQYLNQKGIRTSKGNVWLNTQVYSVLKRYRERQERLELIEKEYPLKWGKMRIEWTQN